MASYIPSNVKTMASSYFLYVFELPNMAVQQSHLCL